MFICTGKITVYRDYVVAYVNNDIARYYRQLLPKYLYVKPPAFPAHVTVIRQKIETISAEALDFLRGCDKMEVQIHSDTEIKRIGSYFYLDAWSRDISDLRVSCNLQKYRIGFDRYHITIGNTKGN